MKNEQKMGFFTLIQMVSEKTDDPQILWALTKMIKMLAEDEKAEEK